MSEMQILEEDLENIKLAYMSIIEAMDYLNEVDDTDEEYKQLDKILESLDNKKTSMQIELENLEEEAMFKENEEQWKAERREEDYQYWGDQY